MKSLDQTLGEHPLFAGLAPEYLELIAGCARNCGAAAGELLMRENEPADTFFLIRRGHVTLETYAPGRGAVSIETLDAGEVLGWSWLFPPYRNQFDARALDVVRAVCFDGACLRGKCADDPVLGYELMRRFSQVMSERLDATRLRLLDVYGDRISV
ncbi:MAG: cyclic nucleotide-binding domain-containing protein [Pseudomonadota bacterium]